MKSDQLEYDVRHSSVTNDVAIIDLHGELGAPAGEALDKAFAQACRQNPRVISLNFGGVSYINSTGVALIIGLLIQATKAGLRLMAYGLTRHDAHVFELARLSEYISIFPDEASALSSVRKSRLLGSQWQKEEQWQSQM